MNYNLEERTLKFSEQLIKLCKKIKISYINKNIIDQLLRSGTSIGANYNEANGASSKKDFAAKAFICKKESKESIYWLKLLDNDIADLDLKTELNECLTEANQLLLIFGKIVYSARQFK